MGRSKVPMSELPVTINELQQVKKKPGNGRGMKENGGGGELKYDTFDTL
jgi:hypothetical protein